MPASPTVDFANMLPPLYAGWMKALLEGPVLDETQATCASCAMASRPGALSDGRELAFKPNAKCCTYHPALPNFSVGMALADASPEAARGRASLERQIALRKGVTPLGLGPTKKAHEDFEREKVERFGRDRELLCPYYEDEGGLCSIWRYRNSTCATYFCKFVRGEVGRVFWRDTLRPLLAAIERVLGQWAALEVGLGEDPLRALFPSADARSPSDACDHTGTLDPALHARLWAGWQGREADFYKACAEKVSALGWADVLRIGGMELRLGARMAREAYDRLMNPTLPEKLAIANFWVVRRGPEVSHLFGYSPLDLLELPNRLVPLLGRLHGRAVAEVPGFLERESGLAMPPDIVRQLLDFGVVKPA